MILQLESILKDVSNNIIKDKSFVTTYKDKDVVTNRDLEAERAIIKYIKAICLHDHFISEEENHQTLTNHPTWIIDPIDGTLNYTRNIPQYGIQIALYENKQPVLSMMYLPQDDILIHAEKGKGCYINHKRVHIEPLPLEQSIVTFGDFSRSQPTSRPKQLELMADFMDHVMKIRIYGASSTDFSYVILNRTQCHVIFTKRIWELAPGLLLIKEAGLQVKHLEFDCCTGYMVGQQHIIDSLINVKKFST